MGAWTALGVLMFLPASNFAQMQGATVAHAALWAAGWGAAGFVLSSALAAFYTKLPERYLRGIAAAAAVLLACVAAALLWNGVMLNEVTTCRYSLGDSSPGSWKSPSPFKSTQPK